MSSTQPEKKPASVISVDIDSLCESEPHLLDLKDFIAEKDDKKALQFWLREHQPNNSYTTREDILFAIDRSITEIDHRINDQLNSIIHHPDFQKLESAWRGIWYLAVQADGVKNLKLKMLDITWKEVARDINRAMEFDQSELFKKIYSDEFGSPGGEPFGVLIGDYEVSHKPSKKLPNDDISTLRGLAQVAAAAFAPFIASASHEFFGLDDFDSLGMPFDLKRTFKQDEYIPWNALRDSPDSRFIGLTVPRVLMRLPYQLRPGSYKGIYFYEKVDKENKNYLWGTAAYAFGAVLIREFGSVGWFGHIRGVPRNQIGGGLISNLPVDSFLTDADKISYKPSTDVVITDAVERELGNQGFVPLCQCYDTPFAAFYSNQSAQRPKYQDRRADTRSSVNAKLSSMLQHVLCGSRVAHYIKVMIRDKIGSFVTAEDCENMLRNWLYKYTSGRDDLEWEEQARFPLREADVKVYEDSRKPGQYQCSIRLVPHYQIDQMVSELELVTELMKAK